MEVFAKTARLFLALSLIDVAVLVVGLVIDNDVVVRIGAILVATSLLMALVFWLVQRRLFGSPAVLRKLAVEGMPANATITGITPTGMVNGAPLLKLELNVNLESITVRTPAPPHKMHRAQVGATLPVRVHPDHPSVAIVDWDSVR